MRPVIVIKIEALGISNHVHPPALLVEKAAPRDRINIEHGRIEDCHCGAGIIYRENAAGSLLDLFLAEWADPNSN
jgi:hypothetical protein